VAQAVVVPDAATDETGLFTSADASQVKLSESLKVAYRPLGRVLRADWEPPEVLLVTYKSDLHESLAEVVAAAAKETDVYVLASPKELRNRRSRGRIDALAGHIISMNHDTPWIRDYGPLEVVSERNGRIWIDLSYYEDRPLDDALPLELSRMAHVQLETYSLVGEGGGVVSNGVGVCAMTTSTFDAAVEYDASAERTEGLLWVFGCQSLAVVPSLSGEETGHVDIAVQFLAQDLVAVAEMDPDYNGLVATELDMAVESVMAAAEALGQSMRVVRVPMHSLGPRFYTYVNGTRVGQSFLVPHYRTVAASLEQAAYRRLRQAMPGVKLVPIYADPMVEQGGAVHCVTLGLGASPLPQPATQYELD
jgi:agmatine deiminase